MTIVRRPQTSEYGLVRALIETVANETFSDLFAPNPVPMKFEDEDWPLAWVAVSDEKIVGVIITNHEWVSDLWVFREHRRQGIGSKLLAQGEAEIAGRGHQTCRLRVVRSNSLAVQFYLSRGWQIAREFAHEKYHHPCWSCPSLLLGSPGNRLSFLSRDLRFLLARAGVGHSPKAAVLLRDWILEEHVLMSQISRFGFLAVLCLSMVSNGLSQSEATQTMRPVIRGRHAAVASMKAEATEAARRILDAGGNAFDAAVAGQAALAVSDFSLNGVGSDTVLLVYDSREKKVYSINGEPRAPRLATIEWYEKNNGGKIPDSDGLLSGGIPGVVDAWYILLDRWGTMNFEQVLQPAIALAENGFPLSERGASYIDETKKILKYPTTVKIYLPHGRPPQAGDILRNPDLARTLKKLVEAAQENKTKDRHEALKAARDRFYKGDIAHDLAAFSEANGGLFRYEDFAEYSAKVETPVSINYRGYQIYKNPSASQGPSELIALNLLEGYNLKAMGHNTADFIHTSVEAVKLAMADREKYLGDMDFIKIPYDGLLSKDYARERRKLIEPSKASLDLRPGTPEKFTGSKAKLDRPVREVLDGNASHAGDTSYIAVIDKDRNMVSFEPSLHESFGTGVVMGDTGILFNCRGDYYSLVRGEANALEPGKRPRSTLQSTLIMKDGQPYAIIGSPGGDDQVMRTMQTLINMIDFGMNIQQAIESPRWSTESFPASPFPHTMYPGVMAVESRIPEATQKALIARGHKLRVDPPWSLGSIAGIVIDSTTGVLSAGADPRVDAYAWAW